MSEGIFILCSERSGGNLLRRMLGNHSTVSAPVPPHLFDSFYSVVSNRLDFSNQRVRCRVLNAMRTLCNHPFSDWKLRATAEEIEWQFEPNSFVAAVDSIYRTKAFEDGKSSYVCKENFLFQYAMSIKAVLGSVRWLHLYRDPRDVVASWLKHRMQYLSEYDAAVIWQEEQKAIKELKDIGSVMAFPIRYEFLVKNPRREMAEILGHLGLPVEEVCFRNESWAPEATRNRLWENLASPVTDRWIGNWRSTLRVDQVRVVETVCRAEMESLDYKTEFTNGNRVALSRRSISSKFKGRLSRLVGRLGSSGQLVRSRERLKRQLAKELSAGM